jgi:hypothetical protein
LNDAMEQLKDVKHLTEAGNPEQAFRVAQHLQLLVSGHALAMVTHRVAMAAANFGRTKDALAAYEYAEALFARLDRPDLIGQAICRRDHMRFRMRICKEAMGSIRDEHEERWIEGVKEAHVWLESLGVDVVPQELRERVVLETLTTQAFLTVMQISTHDGMHHRGPLLSLLDQQYEGVRRLRGNTKAIYELDLLDELIRHGSSNTPANRQRCLRAVQLSLIVGNPRRAASYALRPAFAAAYGAGARLMRVFD